MRVVVGEKSRISQRVIDIHELLTSCSFALWRQSLSSVEKKYQATSQSQVLRLTRATPYRTIFRRLRHLSDQVSSLTLHFVWTTIQKLSQVSDSPCSDSPEREKEAMTSSPKVKYKSIVRQLRRQQIED